MTYEENRRVFKLRCASKQGIPIRDEDQKFCEEMYTKYPEEYKAMNEEVFQATAPFGSKL